MLHQIGDVSTLDSLFETVVQIMTPLEPLQKLIMKLF